MDANEILKKPYARLITPDTDGRFFSEIVEFPGCFATGNTAADALQNLESVAVDWINTAIAQGQDIPEPMDSHEYSGRTVLRMTRGLHRRAALWAEREGVSLNQFITTCLAEAVGERARPPVIYPVAQFQAVMTVAIPPVLARGVNGAGVVLGFSENRALSTAQSTGMVRFPATEFSKEREYA